jgi:hypothetical protein
MISITNAGRGAGKTYELIQWAKADPSRRIIGDTNTRNQMYAEGIPGQFIYLREAQKELRGRHDISGVAFDNFGTWLSDLMYQNYGVTPEHEVILSMDVQERPLPGQISAKEAPLSPKYAANLIDMYGD